MKDRIYGYENEFALLIAPEYEGLGSGLRRIRIYDYLEHLMSTRLRVLPANYRKKGIFLENGGLFNYEALHSNFFEGLLEMATPESRDPREAALYHTAQTQLLYKLIQELNTKSFELDPSFRGRIFIGKSNVDSSGKNIGCHENYLVDDRIGPLQMMVLLLLVPIFWIIHLIILAITFIPIVFFAPLIILLSLVAGSISGFLVVLPRFAKIGQRIRDFVFNFLLHEEFLINHFARVHGDFSRLIFAPWVFLFSAVLSPLLFGRFKKGLTPFLVTRSIFCGSGKVNLPEVKKPPGRKKGDKSPIFEISQRVRAIKRICRIFFDDDRRPIFDLRDFFLEPLTALRRKKRLHILLSDSNMSPICIYLKIGITGLLLEMLEDGCTFDAVQIKNPLEAMRDVSADTSLQTQIPLKKGGKKTAVQIQRFYLERARDYFLKKYPDDERVRDLLEKWEFILSNLEITPSLLYRKVDWVTKKDLIEQVIQGKTTLQELGELSEWIAYLITKSGESVPPAETPVEFFRVVLGTEAYNNFLGFLDSRGLSLQDFIERWRLYYEVLKVDFKFHQVDDEGYYYKLLNSNLVDRIFTDEEMAEAEVMPPRATRAWIRGELIKKYGFKYNPYSPDQYGDKTIQTKCKIGWNKFYLSWPWKRVDFADPFKSELSSIENELER